MRLVAHAAERRAAARQDVVAVDAVEATRPREADEVRLREESNAGEMRGQDRPLRSREVRRVVDEEVADAERPQVRDVRLGAGHGAVVVRLEMRRDVDVVRTRRTDDTGEPRVLRRSPPPPRHDDLVDARARDVTHLRAHDGGVARRVHTARGIEVRRDVSRRRMAVLLPVLIRAVSGGRAVPRVVEDRGRHPL